jgi:Putative MetA-pathway of phenol degradation
MDFNFYIIPIIKPIILDLRLMLVTTTLTATTLTATTLTSHANESPRDSIREMSTDRPDTTESPITVSPGYFQLESSFFEYSRNADSGINEEIFTYGAINLKFGLLSNVDLQLVFDAYTEQKTEDKTTGLTQTLDGFSDLQARVKVNLWGNDGDKTALAFFPFIQIPTGTALSNEAVEGGVILPFSAELTESMSLGLMAEFDFVRENGAADYDTQFLHTAVIGFGVTEKIGVFIEYVGVVSADSSIAYKASTVLGITYGLSGNVQFDGGTRIGLNDAADDLGFFSGVSLRF